MKEIRGDAKTIRQLLNGAKYAIDYYQRDYKWQMKQVQELLDDLSVRFLEDHQASHERSQVEKYGHYFLGSIIISDRDGLKYIIDGQQRLTTLTLLLIYLHNLQKTRSDRVQVSELIYSEKFSRRSFNIDVPERNPCMEALFTGISLDESSQNESNRNILGRYADIGDLFPDELKTSSLPYFIDWLIENVHLVEITAYSDEDAYSIFETMNDRGLSLTPTDMLKGYLLANITDESRRLVAANLWKARINALVDIGKEEDSDCIKAWLRSQHANSIRERKRGAVPQDFDKIGTEFHRWIRDNEEALGLNHPADFATFLEKDFVFYARQYEALSKASKAIVPGLEVVHYNARHNFTLQFPLLLAPLRKEDSEAAIQTKLRIVGTFIDILVTRRIWNSRAIDYSTMQYAMFLIMRDIRGKTPTELVSILTNSLSQEQETFSSNDRFRLHGGNGKQIHNVLARMTEFVEVGSEMKSKYGDYIVRSGKGAYEIEHIWANHPELHKDEFPNATDFEEYRNRIGGLLLLPKSFNASYGDLPYEAKIEHYNTQNLLARSLHELAYQHNPGFLRFLEKTKLAFQAYKSFSKAELDLRQTLYQSLAKAIWNPDRIALIAGAA
ncbi:DUF262 domain-containing protein [Bradyrhizobium sp. 170]|uniref:DUF262 domain-containing protein n=1 Tax=Bradyrhizobium sp. 170 TaxID=2782641 RepID=UPI0020002E7B|nr:DUF262 domain-containing protein [Bradyrhizobium sp. 170]UPK02829.1 DUF262 domain-containing protein [Bradyrhizobium sp. 170]